MPKVICEACHTENPEGNRFCGNCGNPLALLCPNCGHSNPSESKFCGQCGTALDAIATPIEAKSAPTSERRLVSVLFADLTGYTSYAEGRDAEDVRSFLSDYFERSREVIERFGGIVEKFIGDAVMAVWGAETATEDDAERAVRAGLELVEVVNKLSADAGVPELALRVGVHSGEAAVGPSDDHMGFVTGDLVNTASRLESAAEPGTVLVGEGTHGAASRSIVFEHVGARSLKGKALPVDAWRALHVVSERGGRGRTDALEPPFVGRSNELRLLKDMLESVGNEARTRLVSLVGEAGIGKSRLVWEFLKWIDGLAEDIYWHEGRSPSYGDGVTFWAVAEMIKGRAGILEDDPDDVVAERLDEALETYVPEVADRDWIRPRLLPVLGVGEAPPGERSELDAAVRAFFEAIAAQGTTVLIFEDLHWADSALIDFVEELTDWWRNKPILVVTLARTDLVDRRPGWGSARQGVISLTLGPLSDREMTDIVTKTVPALPDEVVSRIVERCAGIPLYAVELLRGLIAQGNLEGEAGRFRVVGDITEIALPESLQAVIGARLDRLDPDDRSLIQDAAVLGHSFSVRGLTALTGREPEDLEEHLHILSRKELIEPVLDPRSPERGQYRFLQAMIREVAAGRMSREARRDRHLAAAEFYDSLEDSEVAVVVASHYLNALDASQEGAERDEVRADALGSMLAAADRAAEVRASEQVLSISKKALEIADTDDERAPFWERMVEAASREARVEVSEDYGRSTLSHYQAVGDQESVWRAAAKLGLAYANNGRPESTIALLAPLVSEASDLSADPALARMAVLYCRALMLADHAEVEEWMDRALAAAEKLNMVVETVDGLITKGTWLGHVGRAIEGKVLLEGAMEMAEPLDVLLLKTRSKNNLGLALAGIDWVGIRRVFEGAYNDARRGGGRAELLFHALQWTGFLVAEGRFAEAKALLDDPMLSDPPPTAELARASSEAEMVHWTGDEETAVALTAKARTLIEQSDDPQKRWVIPHFNILEAIRQGELERAIEFGLEAIADSWLSTWWAMHYSLLAVSLTGEIDRLDDWIETLGRWQPRYDFETGIGRTIRQMADGEVSGQKIDRLVERLEAEDRLTWVVTTLTTAGAFSPPEESNRYLDRARSICTEQGWHGHLELVDRYLT